MLSITLPDAEGLYVLHFLYGRTLIVLSITVPDGEGLDDLHFLYGRILRVVWIK